MTVETQEFLGPISQREPGWSPMMAGSPFFIHFSCPSLLLCPGQGLRASPIRGGPEERI